MKTEPALSLSPTYATACGLPWLRRWLALLVGIGISLNGVSGQTVLQSLTLQPGWNAVFLEVEPADNSPEAVFAGLPIDSVWTRAATVTSAEFIQDPSEAAFNRSGWLAWFPPGRPDAFLSNLKALKPLRSYLIKVSGNTPVNLTMWGSPSFRHPVWTPNAYTLQGFPTDAVTPPTFGQYFRYSAAHVELEAYQIINNAWVRLDPSELMQRGQAYWIYTRGASDYAGPVSLELAFDTGLHFAESLTELSVNYRNLASTPRTLTIEELAATGSPALSYHQFHSTEGNQWLALSGAWTRTCAAGETDRLRLAVRRQDFTTDAYASVLHVKDGAGSEWFIPVTAERQPSPPDDPDPVKHRAGLWLGSASIDAVSEVHSADPTVPTPTRSTFNLRLLVHLDSAGQTRLLKQVILMWQKGTLAANADGDLEVTEPGRHVLITDDRLIGLFDGAALRDGTAVGRRLSAVGYEFADVSGQNFVELDGEFGFGQLLVATLHTPGDHPTNPFRHRFHPDHDNLNARFDGPAEEAYATSREIQLEFTSDPPPGTAPTPDYGYNQMGGFYRETIVGLHKNDLRISGTFTLTRISLVAELNPSPNR